MVHAPKDGAPAGETQGEQKAKPSRKEAALGCGLTLCLVAIAVIGTLMAVGVLEMRPAVADPPAEQTADFSAVTPPTWVPPEWLSGYWSTSDNSFLVEAEPGAVTVIAYGDGKTITYSIQEWTRERGDVFRLDAIGDETRSTGEWEHELTRRGYRDDGQEWAAQALDDDGTVAVEIAFRHTGSDSVMLIVTMGEERVVVLLERDE